MTGMVNYDFLNQSTPTAMKQKLNFISFFNNAHTKNKLIQAKNANAFIKAYYETIKATV